MFRCFLLETLQKGLA
ncbi:hypothetical protein VCHENC02_0749A, partial [Vibrio harveyi]